MTLLPTILIAALVFGVALAGMAIGVIVSNRRIKGSCGGIANLNAQGVEVDCPVCGGDDEMECRDPVARPTTAGVRRDACEADTVLAGRADARGDGPCRGEACENFSTCGGRDRAGS